MAYQIKDIIELKGKRKGLDVVVDLGFRQKTLYFESQKVFDAEFPKRMMQAELNVQADLDQEAYDRNHPTFYSREDLKAFLVIRNMITPTQEPEDLATKNRLWSALTDYDVREGGAILNKLFGTNW